MTDSSGLPAGRRVVLDDRVRVWRDASVVLGGAPWGLLRIAPAARGFLRRLADAGAVGAVPEPGIELAVVNLLLARGVVHPVIEAASGDVAVDVVVPAYGAPELLEECLSSLRRAAPNGRIIVVDDASPTGEVAAVARSHGATLLQHRRNRGPAAARNTGVRETTSPIVAFVDADCAVTPGWLAALTAHFDDPRVAAVAPRIAARSEDGAHGVLARFEAARSALDMGPRPELVTHGAPLGFLPSAAIAIRRACLREDPFDEQMRVGEDVDLVWRLIDDGGLVRYEPASRVTHAIRPQPLRWAGRIRDYGTSAAELDRRHPGRLTPARLSVWNVAGAALLLAGRPSRTAGAAAAAATIALSGGLLARTLRGSQVDLRVAPVIVGKGLASDAASAGHLLRREWWPVGWLALVASPWSVPARAAAAAMLVPPVWEWLSRRPALDPLRYLALRLVADAAYGSGAIAGALRSRRRGVLRPSLRLPWLR